MNDLMTADGVRALKVTCFKNLDLSKGDSETEILSKFLELAKQEGWMIKTASKAEKDIMQNFHVKRNYLKAQIRLRVLDDLVNKSPEHAENLPKTSKFLREHLMTEGLDLDDECKLILFMYGFVTMKYFNKKIKSDSLSTEEKKSRARARESVWVFTMERVEGEKSVGRDFSHVKSRLAALLKSGQDFEVC